MMILLVNNIPEIQSLCKSYGVKNYSRLQRKHIVDKNGHSRVVYVKPDETKKYKTLKSKIKIDDIEFNDDESEIINEFRNEELNNKNTEVESMSNLLGYLNGRKGSEKIKTKYPMGNSVRISTRRKIQELKSKYGYDVIKKIIPEIEEKENLYVKEMLPKMSFIKNGTDITKGCKNIKDLEKLVKQKEWFPPYKEKYFSLKGCDFGIAKEIVNVYDFMFRTFPGLKKHLAPCTFVKLDDADFAEYDPNTKMINCNLTYFSDYNTFRNIHEDQIKKQFHPQGTDCMQIFIHEIIHSIDDEILPIINLETGEQKKVSKYINDKLDEELKLSGSDVRYGLSEYALQDSGEFLAEGLSEYIDSVNPRPLSEMIMKYFLKLMYNRSNKL